MSTKELNLTPALRAAIAESVQEVLSDPDFVMELTDAAKKRLRAAMKHSGRGKSLAEIRAQYC